MSVCLSACLSICIDREDSSYGCRHPLCQSLSVPRSTFEAAQTGMHAMHALCTLMQAPPVCSGPSESSKTCYGTRSHTKPCKTRLGIWTHGLASMLDHDRWLLLNAPTGCTASRERHWFLKLSSPFEMQRLKVAWLTWLANRWPSKASIRDENELPLSTHMRPHASDLALCMLRARPRESWLLDGCRTPKIFINS